MSGLFGASRTPFGDRYWIIAIDYELARPEFNYWCEFLGNMGAFRSTRDISVPKLGKCQATTKSGQLIETKTADDIRKIAAVAPDGIIMAEAAQMTYETYLKCVGRLSEKRGWLLMSGTFEGSAGWYPETWTEWLNPHNIDRGRSFSLPTWSNTVIFPEGRNDPEILAMERAYARVEGMFEERCGATPIPPTNLVFRDFRHTVHMTTMAEYTPKRAVFLAVDPSSGTDPYAVLACQFSEYPQDLDADNPDRIDYCDVIDEFYANNVITEDIVDELRHRPWWKDVKGGAIDPEAPDEKRRWMKYGRVPLLSRDCDVFEGIRRMKSFLYYKRETDGHVSRPPHLRINPEVKSLPYEFTHFKRKVVATELTDKAIDKLEPYQDDHSVKALWYLLVGRYGYVKAGQKAKVGNSWRHRRR